MATARSKRFDEPDEVRTFPDGEAAVLDFGEVSIGLGRLRPGWSFSKSMQPVVGGASCQIRHVGYALSGHLRVRMDGGDQIEIGPGEGYFIPPGHQAEVVGDEDFVGLEFDTGAIAKFGKPGQAG